MTKRTVGPWVFDDGQGSGNAFVIAGDGRRVADCGSGTRDVAENQANARVCAAADRLLTAVEAYLAAKDEVTRYWANNADPITLEEFARREEAASSAMRAAVAQAHGQSEEA